MTVRLSPVEGFDWSRVRWGAPEEVRSDFCSYCPAEIPDDSVPLMMWTAEGWCAQFCDKCQRKWWGFE